MRLGLKLSLVLIGWSWRTHFQGGCLMWLPERMLGVLGACRQLSPKQVMQGVKAKRAMPFMTKSLKSQPINS